MNNLTKVRVSQVKRGDVMNENRGEMEMKAIIRADYDNGWYVTFTHYYTMDGRNSEEANKKIIRKALTSIIENHMNDERLNWSLESGHRPFYDWAKEMHQIAVRNINA